ncbi:MAG: TonB-dependent receptor [Burkholderiales bacterium]|nr:TonB-dependent receptor [Burkholderiales bacterium]
MWFAYASVPFVRLDFISRCLAGLVGLLTLTQPLRAQETPVVAVPETVVTAARIRQNLSDTLQPTTVIDAEDIVRSGQQTLPELLQSLAGVEITSSGGSGQSSSVFIRGANSDHTLVLVDGLRVNSATAGTTAFEHLPIDQIDRIEIVSGPLSSLYGSDAVGGVIQIFTKSGDRSPKSSASAGYGSYNTRRAAASFSGNVKDTDFNLAAGYYAIDGFDATKSTIPFDQHNDDRDGYRNTNVSARLAHRFDAGNSIGLTAFHSDGRTEFDNGPTTSDVNKQSLSAYSIYSQNRITASWQSLLRLGTGRDDAVFTGAFPAEFRTDQHQANWQNTFAVIGGSLIAGAEYRREDVSGDTIFIQTRRNIRSAFGGYRGDYGKHGVQLNARHDDYSDFGGRTTGSIGYGYRLTDAIRVRAAAGTAFHAPTFNDLYFPADPIFGGGGNPELEPERSRSREFGVDYQRGAQRFAATWFDNRIEDLIVFDLATFTPQNLDSARIKGGEFSYNGTLLGTGLRAKFTAQDPENARTGLQLQRRARRHGSVAASRALGAWKFGAEVIASSERFDSNSEDQATRLGGYALLNLYLARRLFTDWEIDVRWNNVTDRDYELAQHFNTPDSNVFVSLRWTPQR